MNSKKNTEPTAPREPATIFVADDEAMVVESRLSPIVQAAFNEEITKRDVRGVLSGERDKVMTDVRSRLADEAKSFGIEIVDVRIKRVDFVADITESVWIAASVTSRVSMVRRAS